MTNPLADIALASEIVKVNGKDYKVAGIPFAVLLDLIARFPNIGAVLTGGVVNALDVMKFGGPAVASIIAGGFGKAGDEQVEASALAMPLETSLDFILAILKATMPNGAGPFVEKINAIRKIVQVEEVAEAAPRKPGEVVTMGDHQVRRMKASPSVSPSPLSSSSPEAATSSRLSGI